VLPQPEDHTLPDRCRNAALCITAKSIAEWQRWVIRIGPMQGAASPDVRFTANSIRIFTAEGIDAECHLQTSAYSITSSAIASSDGGTVMPSILAVWALMTKSNLDACTTGRSAGLAPLRMRPA
jgi:hypothetical protein